MEQPPSLNHHTSLCYYHACCFAGDEESLRYAALPSAHVQPEETSLTPGESVTVVFSVFGSSDRNRHVLQENCAVYVLEAPFSRMQPVWPPVEVGVVVVLWTLGDSSHTNADPFDSSVSKLIVVRRGVVASHGRLDIVFVLVDGETAARRVKRSDLRRIVAERAASPHSTTAVGRRAKMSRRLQMQPCGDDAQWSFWDTNVPSRENGLQNDRNGEPEVTTLEYPAT